MKTRIGSLILLALAIAAVMVLGTPRTAPAKNGCTDATLKGAYGIRLTGMALSGPFTGPIALVGVITFDGTGQLTLSLTQRLNTASGPTTLSKVPYVGTYTVSPDCTFEDVWHNLSNGGTAIHEGAIIDNGRGFLIINTTAGPTVVSGEGRKQFSGDNDRN